MEQKKSKVKSISEPRTWKDLFFFTVEFENGDKGDFTSKTNPQTTFTVGKEEEYTREETPRKDGKEGVNIKIGKPGDRAKGAGGYRDPVFEKVKNILIIRQSCLSNAINWAASKNQSLKSEKDIGTPEVLAMAETMFNWVIKPVADKINP